MTGRQSDLRKSKKCVEKKPIEMMMKCRYQKDIKEHEPENIGDLFRGSIILMNQLEKCRYGSFTVTYPNVMIGYYPNVMFFCVSVKSQKLRTVSSSSR